MLLSLLFSTVSLLAIVLAGGIRSSDSFSPSDWPLPHNVTGTNTPGNWGGVHVHDPSITFGPDGFYYSFSTHGLVSVSRAPSLDGPWTHIGSALDKQSIIDLPGRNDTWAPDVSKLGDTYHCFYSVSTFGSQDSAIGLATSKTLLPGNWTDHGAVLTSGKAKPYPLNATNGIDPNLFVDEKTGEMFLTYGSFWSDIWQFDVQNGDFKSLESNKAIQLSFEPKGTNPEEGAFLSENDGWYYLWISHGICCGYNTTLPAKGEEYVLLTSLMKLRLITTQIFNSCWSIKIIPWTLSGPKRNRYETRRRLDCVRITFVCLWTWRPGSLEKLQRTRCFVFSLWFDLPVDGEIVSQLTSLQLQLI
jgi:hypothetical protein